MNPNRQAFSLPARLQESYDDDSASLGSDSVFEPVVESLSPDSAEEEGGAIDAEKEGNPVSSLPTPISSEGSTLYYTSSGSSALLTSDIDRFPSTDKFEFARGANDTPGPAVIDAVGLDLLKEQIPPISPSRMQKLSLKEDPDDDKFDEESVIFKLKKWNHVSLWKWDVDCDICPICRVVVSEPCLKCQTSGKGAADCAVVWGECNHSYHNCCMSRWVATTPRCPLCQQTWVVQRIGT